MWNCTRVVAAMPLPPEIHNKSTRTRVRPRRLAVNNPGFWPPCEILARRSRACRHSGGTQVPLQGEEIALGEKRDGEALPGLSWAAGGPVTLGGGPPLQQQEQDLRLHTGFQGNGEVGYTSPFPMEPTSTLGCRSHLRGIPASPISLPVYSLPSQSKHIEPRRCWAHEPAVWEEIPVIVDLCLCIQWCTLQATGKEMGTLVRQERTRWTERRKTSWLPILHFMLVLLLALASAKRIPRARSSAEDNETWKWF